jgi:hypothetical protein
MGAIAAEIRIRQEFDEPPSQVIKQFADSKYSKRLAAGAIGITTQTLRRLCRQYGVSFVNQKDMCKQCKGHGNGWPKGKPRMGHCRYSIDSLLSLRLRSCHYETCREFEQRTGMQSSTIIRRFGTWRNYQYYGNNKKRS